MSPALQVDSLPTELSGKPIYLSNHLHIAELKQLHSEVDCIGGFPGGSSGNEPACQCRRHETQVRFLGQEDPLEEGMATPSSILVWRIPGTEEPGRL